MKENLIAVAPIMAGLALACLALIGIAHLIVRGRWTVRVGIKSAVSSTAARSARCAARPPNASARSPRQPTPRCEQEGQHGPARCAIRSASG